MARRILIILTETNALLGADMASRQQDLPNIDLTVVNLTAEPPNYDDLLRRIFEADSVQVY